jgi:hypothetical protein
MAKKKRRPITTNHVISTLVSIRHLTDALIATLMEGNDADFSGLPQPLYLNKAYAKDCPPPEAGATKAWDKGCPPPEMGATKAWDKGCSPPEMGATKAWDKSCLRPEGTESVPTRTRFVNCGTYDVMVPPSLRKPRKRRKAK